MRSARRSVLCACSIIAAATAADEAAVSNATAKVQTALHVVEQMHAEELLTPALRAAAAATHTAMDSLTAQLHLHSSRPGADLRKTGVFGHLSPLPAGGGDGAQRDGWLLEDVPPVDTQPHGHDIWDPNVTWSTITRWKPSGLISNVNGGEIRWTHVSYMSLNILLLMSMVCYPALLIGLIMLLTILVSVCLVRKPPGSGSGNSPAHATFTDSESPPRQLSENANRPPVPAPPVIRLDQLSPMSQKLYYAWGWFCCTIPSLFVFGLPVLLIALSNPFPQETFSIMTFVTSLLMCSNGMYMVIFAGSSVIRMRQSMSFDYSRMLAAPVPSSDAPSRASSQYTIQALQVRHWVVLPQYKEDMEVVAMALESISRSNMASEQIGIVLAMEEREVEAKEKSEELTRRFAGRFSEIISCFHPPNLPNDPPGKASNLAWAFKHLSKHLGTKSTYEASQVILTVSDADSEFHHGYFEGLTHLYLDASQQKRKVTIWQSPVFHVKNYHRQPMPVIVGTMFTCMQELACLSDPHAIRFPYSTYSLSFDLAHRVGGWDAEWIAEDWHMGIKCFLLTLGESYVEPILLPTANYTPEDSTYLKTVNARWSQAKRHALGFSDMAYFFQMIPLIFCHAVSNSEAGSLSAESLRKFWSMTVYGIALVVKLTNVHVIIGVLTTYGAVTVVLKFVMEVLLTPDRHIELLMDRTHFCATLLWVCSLGCSAIVTLMFQGVYELMKRRMEGEAFNWRSVHLMKTMSSFAIFGPLYFIALGIAVWKAAISMLFQKTFDYEVAMKPTAENRLNMDD